MQRFTVPAIAMAIDTSQRVARMSRLVGTAVAVPGRSSGVASVPRLMPKPCHAPRRPPPACSPRWVANRSRLSAECA